MTEKVAEAASSLKETDSDAEFYDACDDLAEDTAPKSSNAAPSEKEKVFLENYDSEDNGEDEEDDLPDFESRPEIKKLKSKLNKLHMNDEDDFRSCDFDTDAAKEGEEEEDANNKPVRLHFISIFFKLELELLQKNVP